MTTFVWIPEAPDTPIALYAIAHQEPIGVDGEMQISTMDVHRARQFETQAECQAWCDANPTPVFRPVEHAITLSELVQLVGEVREMEITEGGVEGSPTP